MNSAFARLGLKSLIALGIAGPASTQSVYVVDDDGGPGDDFTEVQDAVNVAVPGDRVEVRAGIYGPITITRGVTIMGEVNASPQYIFIHGVTIQDLPSGELVLVADLDFPERVELFDCAGTIVLDRVLPVGVVVERCADVRFQEAWFGWGAGSRFQDSLVQFTSSRSLGTMEVVDARVVIAHSTLRGRDGGAVDCGPLGSPPAPDGTDALVVSGRSTVWLLRSPVLGGTGGLGCSPTEDGENGRAIVARDYAVVLRCKELTLPWLGGGAFWSPPPTTVVTEGFATVTPVDDLPSMTLEGRHEPSTSSTLRVFAGAGTSARYFGGRASAIVPYFQEVPILTSLDRGASLAQMPPGEEVSIGFGLPAFPRGTPLFFQATRTRSGGQTSLSNSPCLIVR